MTYRFYRKSAEEVHYGYVAILTNFYIQSVHLLDLIADSNLAFYMFNASKPREERWKGYEDVTDDSTPKDDYNIAFVFIMMAIFGPYIIQFSSMINAYFVKGLYTDERWKNFRFCRRVQLILSLSILGLIQLPFLDIYIKI